MLKNNLPEAWPWSEHPAPRYAKVPAYVRLEDEIREMIESGRWKPDSPIPTEREIALCTGLSANTIKKALTNLTVEKLIYRRQGIGTFVASLQTNMFRYYKLQGDLDLEVLILQVPHYTISKIALDATQAKYLHCPEHTLGFCLKRIMAYQGHPLAHSISYFQAAQVPHLEEKFPSAPDIPLYSFLEQTYQVSYRQHKELLSAVACPAESAEALGVSPGSLVLMSQFVAETFRAQPVELRYSYILTGEYRLVRGV